MHVNRGFVRSYLYSTVSWRIVHHIIALFFLLDKTCFEKAHSFKTATQTAIKIKIAIISIVVLHTQQLKD